MCGISGILSLDRDRPIDAAVLAAMSHALFHRGPDSDGLYEEPGRIGMAIRRLSIIDVDGGDQPIFNEDRTVAIVFNGEIYNFRDLRQTLASKGHRFRTRSDTEVIVHAYEEFGDDCVTHLQGMFSFALWDASRQRLLLARDRVGIKQLFYALIQGQLLWGSEIKALLQHPSVCRRLRPAAVNHFLTYLYVPEPLTMFEGIKELPAGHVLVAENGSVKLRRYWQLRYDVDESLRSESAAEGLRARLDEAVRVRLISDVPLGAFLSGGIDSGAVVALMAGHSTAPVETFSIGYAGAGQQFDERVFARELAERYGTRHHEFVMEPDLTELAPNMVRAFDQPMADASAIPTWCLCEFTRRYVTVALSGLGGDEAAAGYERYRGSMLGEHLGWIPAPLVQRLLVPLANALPDSRSGSPWTQRIKRMLSAMKRPFDERYFELLSALSKAARADILTEEMIQSIELDEPLDVFRGHVEQVSESAPLNRALFADLKLFLPSNLLTLTDRMSMAHSLEVRLPYLDHRLLEYMARVPPALKLRRFDRKHVLKRAVGDLMPPGSLKRRKMGFSLPLAVWFRGELRDYVEDVLSEAAVHDARVFRYEAVRRILDDHYARRANYDNQIWAFIVFTLWYRTYIVGTGNGSSAHRTISSRSDSKRARNRLP